MAKYEVIVSDEARKLMGNCVLFLAEKDIDAAIRLKECLLESIRGLEHIPARFPYFNEPAIQKNKYHKMFVENVYLVLYQVMDDIVYVDYVLDCRQDYYWLIH